MCGKRGIRYGSRRIPLSTCGKREYPPMQGGGGADSQPRMLVTIDNNEGRAARANCIDQTFGFFCSVCLRTIRYKYRVGSCLQFYFARAVPTTGSSNPLAYGTTLTQKNVKHLIQPEFVLAFSFVCIGGLTLHLI